MIQRPNFKRYIIGADDAALAGAAATVIAGGTSAVAQSSMNKKTREFNREEAEKQRAWSEKMYNAQNQWNLDMWNLKNEYDAPAAQMERLKAAGLNPLYYGLDGNASGAMQGAAQPLGYERASADNQINPISAGVQSAVEAAQVANIEAQTQKTKTETKAIDAKLPFEVDNLRAQIRNSNLSSDAQETINKYIDRQQEAELRMKTASAAEAEKAVEKAAAEIEKMDYEKTTMFIGWLETQERILNLQKQRELTDKQMEELQSLINVNNQTAAKIGLDVKNYDDITVIGTASTSMKFGPFSVAEGEPITLGMKKAAEAHRQKIENDRKDKSKHTRSGEQISATDGSPYTGPIYD